MSVHRMTCWSEKCEVCGKNFINAYLDVHACNVCRAAKPTMRDKLKSIAKIIVDAAAEIHNIIKE